ncbi:MAG: hypothetical protein IPF54_01595 [Draconibacterium sp.]|nr:hypothetical protein [Draconibacterium sp.]
MKIKTKKYIPMNNPRTLLLVFFTAFLSVTAISQTKYRVVEELDVKVSMSDGIRLSTNIYRPDTTGVFPAILIRSPYGNGGSGNKEGHFLQSMVMFILFRIQGAGMNRKGNFTPCNLN